MIQEQPAPEPEAAAEPAPTAPAQPEVLAVQAPAPEFILELPLDWPPASEAPAEVPANPAPPAEEPEPEPEPPAQEESASLTAVVLRLQDGATLEVGTFPSVAEAAAEAQEVVIEIAAADRNSTWPFFAQRYLRPDLIISVDLVEEELRQLTRLAARPGNGLTGEGSGPTHGPGRGWKPSVPGVGGSEAFRERVFAGQQPVGDRDLPPSGDAELLAQDVAVRLRRPRRDAEALADLVVRQPGGDQLDHLALPLRDPEVPLGQHLCHAADANNAVAA